MVGNSIEEDWEFSSALHGVRTLVLVGRTGNGKSATGNSILGRNAFQSMNGFEGVTSTCELQRTVLEDGQILNVIDTPGLFDSRCEPESIGNEIVRCISMAKDGIHAILVVLSLNFRFTQEQGAVVEALKNFFGSKIGDYMIVVFTAGDNLKENETLDCYSSHALKEMLETCGNRWVVFENQTKDEVKKAKQLEQLLFLVNDVVMKNEGKPYTDELFVEFKKEAMMRSERAAEVDSLKGYSKHAIIELNEQVHKAYEEQMQRFTAMVNAKLEETTIRLQQQLAQSNEKINKLKEDLERALWEVKEQIERAQRETENRKKAEKIAQAAQEKSNNEIRKLREDLYTAQWQAEKIAQAIHEQSNDEIRKLRKDLDRAQREGEKIAQATQEKSKDEIRKLRKDLDKAQREAEKIAQKIAQATQEESNDEIRKLREDLDRAQNEADQNKMQFKIGKCAML